MDSKYFLQKSHVNVSLFITIIYTLIVAFLIFVPFRNNIVNLELSLILILITIVVHVLIHINNSIGLYINKKNIYYKDFKTHNINIQDIAGIKIIQAYSSGKYRGFYPLKNKKGDLLYSAIILRALTDDMYTYRKGDLWFNKDFKSYIICSVVYKKNAIDYLKNINPNIKIIC